MRKRLMRSGPGGDVSRSRSVARTPGPDLLDDPFPAPISPCLAKSALRPPSGSDWVYEVKWDGYRLFIERHPDGRLVLRTRGGYDWTDRFPGILAAARNVPAKTFIIDGEAVVLNDQGVSDFSALQSAARRRSSGEVLFYGFDLLYRDGTDLRHLPLVERRAALTAIIGGDPHLRMSETVEADGAAFLFAERPLALDEKAATLLGDQAKTILRGAHAALGGVSGEWNAANAEAAIREFATAGGHKLGAVAQPLRAALTGKSTSPGVFDVLAVLGRDESLARIGDQID